MELTNDSQNLTFYAMLIGTDDKSHNIISNNKDPITFTDQNVVKLNVSDDNDGYLYNYSMQCLDSYYNMSYLNVSCESNLKISVIFYGYFFPLLFIITAVANSLIVVVLSRRNMASPTNSVLMGKWSFVFSSDIYFLHNLWGTFFFSKIIPLMDNGY